MTYSSIGPDGKPTQPCAQIVARGFGYVVEIVFPAHFGLPPLCSEPIVSPVEATDVAEKVGDHLGITVLL